MKLMFIIIYVLYQDSSQHVIVNIVVETSNGIDSKLKIILLIYNYYKDRLDFYSNAPCVYHQYARKQ